MSDVCSICLATAEARGGEFLVSPGCCGKWYHQSCIRELKACGKNFCPACMKPFPSGQADPSVNIFSPPAPVPAPVAVALVPPAVPLTPSPPFQQQLPPGVNHPSHPNNRQQRGGVFQNMYSNIFGGAVQTLPPPHTNLLDEELLDETVPVTTTAPIAAPGEQQQQLNISIIPECNPISIERKDAFYAQVSATFQDTTDYGQFRNGIDCSCILDNSGSMSGSKIAHLKFAVEFVISMLSEKDRLSVVTFNSKATKLHGLLKMNAANKETAKGVVGRIDATGGTDIYDGMRTGWNVLKNRRTKNAATCVFLLTDGQDGSNLTEKKQLAAEMKEAGAALFVYGFGADHDSAHMSQIANAGEGGFVYIETNDTVVDAFGGALGTQQGMILRNVEFTVRTESAGMLINEVLSGSYRSEIAPDHRSMTIRVADLFNGEKRDFIVKLFVPEIEAPVEEYGLLSAQATYKKQGVESSYFTSELARSQVTRLTAADFSTANPIQSVEVDAQVMRLLCAKAIADARQTADRGQYKDATGILEAFRAQLTTSPSFLARNAVTVSLLEEVNDLFDRVKSRDEYEHRGGRAQMYESATNHDRQRSTYTKNARSHTYQTTSSCVAQTSATMSKTKR